MSNLAWLICRDPVHIGGADSSSRGNSNPIYRLPDRTPVIPGSSLRGALREHSQEEYDEHTNSWFGSDSGSDDMKPGAIALGWAFPLWFPIHVLGYGTWWVTCPDWIQRFRQLNHQVDASFDAVKHVYSPNPELVGQTVYLRWLKLDNIQLYQGEALPFPREEIDPERCIIVPSDRINLLVEMGLIRQPRVDLKSLDELETDIAKDPDSDKAKTLVKNLFSVEGLPPGAIFFFSWMMRQLKDETDFSAKMDEWKTFLKNDHYIGGLWGIGYGRVSIFSVQKEQNNQ